MGVGSDVHMWVFAHNWCRELNTAELIQLNTTMSSKYACGL